MAWFYYIILGMALTIGLEALYIVMVDKIKRKIGNSKKDRGYN
jgi:hypothetical protein